MCVLPTQAMRRLDSAKGKEVEEKSIRSVRRNSVNAVEAATTAVAPASSSNDAKLQMPVHSSVRTSHSDMSSGASASAPTTLRQSLLADS